MDSSRSSVGLIDDDGNVFGVVNIVDILVVLLVLALTIAGGTLVFTGGVDSSPPDLATTQATIDLGTQPDYIASEIDKGDTYSPTANSNLTITDIHIAPRGTETHVTLGVSLQGLNESGNIRYTGSPPRINRTIDVETNSYHVSGQITDAGSESTPDTGTTTVVVRDTVSTTEADEIASGDEITVAGRTVATVEDVAVYATADPNRRTVLVEAALDAYTREGARYFGDTRLRPNNSLTLSGAEYTLDGRLERVGAGLERDSLTTRTVTLEATGVSEAVAGEIRTGAVEDRGGPATVTAVSVEPTQIVATADDGTTVVDDHPTRRDVTLTTELRVRETPDGVRYAGERLQVGSTVALDLGTVTVEATVTDLGQ